ncbi:MAG: methyl-accepting chemotaxis protein [Sphingomonas adhaesiva]|uniref:methyl-accepting chemotaxis protein n=1 Tax=Sphingomonas adhaesiva TaxID=28212 RepID=UPI002FF56971
MQSINRMMMAAIAAIIGLLLVSGGSSLWSNDQQAKARGQLADASKLLRNHMTADMMHDAVRGDVLSILRAAGSGDLDLAANRKALETDAEQLRTSLTADAAYAAAPRVTEQARAIQPMVDDYIATANAIAQAATSDPARASTLLPRFLTAFEKLEGGMETLSDSIEQHLVEVDDSAAATATLANILLAITAGATLALVIAIGLLCRRHVVAPLTTLVGVVRRMTAGELDVTMPATGRRDELGQLSLATGQLRDQLAAAEQAKAEQTHLVVASVGQALTRLAEGDLVTRIDADLGGPFARIKDDFNLAVATLQSTLSSVVQAASNINGGAGDIRQASDELSQRTEQQAASLEETAAAMDQITATVKSTAARADQANSAVSSATAEARRSGTIVRDAVGAMSGIERTSGEISEIISVIDGIAFQTNLLALNAGVEAARAGDAGKGFAVVASEVRALAQRSADAAKDVKARITASSEHVGEGVRLVGETGAALSRIIERIDEIDALVSEIATSADQQATGLQQVNTAVSEMDGVTQQNAAMVEQATAAARSLAADADTMASQIARFRIGDDAPRPVAVRPSAPAPRPAPKSPAPQRAAAPVQLRTVGNAALAPADEDWTEF